MKMYRNARPEDFAVSSAAIRQTIHEIREVHKLNLHSFLMLRRGVLIWEEYFRKDEKERLHVLHSVSKSFTSTAIGLAQAEGLLSIEDKLYDFFPEYADTCDSDDKRALTLRHLLMMGSGFENREHEMWVENTPVKAALALPVIHKPGTVFDYYTLGTYLLSIVFSRVNPEGIHAYLRRKLLEPMGCGVSQWNVDDDNGVPFGGFGMFLTAYDITRLGQLYLNGGAWEGQQLLPTAYAREATARQICNCSGTNKDRDWQAGYGYQFWRNSFGGFRADGMHGQYIIVLPEQEAVIVMTSHLQDMQLPLTAVETHLLPGMG